MKSSFVVITFLLTSFHVLAGSGPWYAVYEKALQAQADGKWRESIMLLKEAVTLRPDPKSKARTYGLRFINYLPYYYMGIAHINLDEKQEALRSFQKETEKSEIQNAPDELEAMQKFMANLTGDRPITLADKKLPEVVQPALPAAGMPWYVSYEAGLAYLESGDWFKAEEFLKSALVDNSIPRQYLRTYGMWYISYLPYYHLGTVYYEQGLWGLAIDFFEASERFGVIREFPKQYELLQQYEKEARRKRVGGRRVSENVKEAVGNRLVEAIQMFHAQEYVAAAKSFGLVMQLDPHNSVARTYMAKIPATAGDAPSVGKEDYRKQQNDYMAGVQSLLLGDYDSAIALLQSVQKQNAKDPGFHAFLGSAHAMKYFSSNRIEKSGIRLAEKEFATVLSLDPSYVLDARVFPDSVLELFFAARKKREQR
ncbi:MAG TPA: hypothetical protein VGB89_16910 [Bacteroidota bacterium]